MLRKALPIRVILLSAFLLAGLLPTILIASLAYSEARSALKVEIEHDMQTRANATAGEVDRMMFERLQNVASWSQLEIMQDVRIEDVDKRLSKFLAELKSSYQDVYTELYVLDTHGTVIASSDPLQIGKLREKLEPWLTTQLSQSIINIAKLHQQQLPISTSIVNVIDGENIGTLIAVFDWKQITHILENSISGRSSAALFDENNQMLAITATWPEAHGSKNIMAEAKTSGYQTFTGFAWSIHTAKHRTEAFAPIHRMTNIFIGLLLASIVLATIIAIPVAKSITGPLARLTAFASNFIRAPSHVPPPAGGPAEIDSMSQAFGKMISDLERSKENLTRAAKLAVVGEMAAAMSHEVRTPLGILRSSAQLLLREPKLSDEGREVCGFIISETERLNRLVSTLIDSARPRAPEFSPVDISELARHTIAMLSMQAQKKNISLKCEDSASAGTKTVIASCDAEQITQVLLNLLLNAIQVLPEGGHILISTRNVADYVLLTVADDGPGVPEDQRKQIFDPFFTQRAGGIGLGLAVVRQIVLAHHGEISVHESAMHGAEFRLKLPVSATLDSLQ
ncbi:MAG TPA: ATP-binding protein [Methylophilaceae bacterium]|nr:ATP-binding protein [Methylophilaceae bacterium]